MVEKCILCKDKNVAQFGRCKLCDKLMMMSIGNNALSIKADILMKAYDKDLISTELLIIKRDRLLHLKEIADDKYLIKLKKEVDKI